MTAPTGEVTLVFTDIQGSTALWETMPRAMSEALAVHDALLRETMADLLGYEVKTEGDAFMVAFARPEAALAWCLVVQEGLTKMPWPAELLVAEAAREGLRVRMGLHMGTPECRPDPVTGRMDYFGPAVNRAARVAGAAHGGQILISDAAFGEVREDVDVVVEDLGDHRLKGLQGTERLRSVLPRSLAGRRFPPPSTLTVRFDLAPRRRRGLDRTGLDDALRQVTEALAARGEVRRWQGKAEEAEDDLQTALTCARKLGDRQVEAYVHVNLGRLQFMTSRTEVARESFSEGRRLAIESGDRWTEAAALSYIAACDTTLGRDDVSLESYRAALVLSRAIGNVRQEGVLLSNLGHHELSRGRVEEAEAHLRAAFQLLRKHRHDDIIGGVINNLGVVAVELDRDDAAEILGEALAEVRGIGERRMEGIIRSNLAAWLLGRGDRAAAEEHGRAAIEALVAMSDAMHAGLAAVPLAMVLQQTGRADEAAALLRERLAAVDSWPAPLEGQVVGRLAAVCADLGRAREAEELIHRVESLEGTSAVLDVVRGHLEIASGDRTTAPKRLEVDASRSADLRIAVCTLRTLLADTSPAPGETAPR